MMRVALLSDVHANMAALDAVLRRAEADRAEAIWHMGDLVGYGPDPDEVIARLVELDARCVLGNHDAAVAGLTGLDTFNDLAADGCRWTIDNSTAETRAFLAALPRSVVDGDFTRVHGSLREPLWEYLATYEAAEAHFARQQTRFSVFGHTHLPALLFENGDGDLEALTPADGEVAELAELRCAINPGGIGQPRDGDPRACYALLDTAMLEVTFRRVPYDVPTTQRRIIERGLPRFLAMRLAAGR